jgi:alpha-galactosidase
MEPERLCKNIPIMKTHQEWFLPGDRGCFYPNLTLSEAYNYTFLEMSRLIETYQLVWMKVDFNFRFGIDSSGAEFADYYTKWYQLLDELNEKYPHVFFEGCASGAMRLDLNTLSHFDGHFLSDNVNPWDMLRISQSALLRLPPGKITKWAVIRNSGKSAPIYGSKITFENRLITPAGNGATWNEFESVNLEFAVLAALPGAFGLSGDLASLSEKDRSTLQSYTSFYKEWREFISNSSAELLTPVKPLGDRQGWVALQLVNSVYKKMLLFVYRLESTDDKISLKLRHINSKEKYIPKVILNCLGKISVSEISEYGNLEIKLPETNSACCCVVKLTQ